MRNELNRHKRGDKIKWIITAICIVLLTVMVAGVCMQLFATDDKFKPSEWFKPSIKFVDVELSEYDKDDEGNLLETFTVLEPDEKGQVTLTYDSNRKLAKPIVSELDKAKIEYTIKIEFKSPTSEEFTEITLESYLEGNSGTYKGC